MTSFCFRGRAGLALLAFVALLSITPSSLAGNDKPKDVESIDPNVGKGVNFYSLDKEIALGKQLAQEVERQSKIVKDPTVAE